MTFEDNFSLDALSVRADRYAQQTADGWWEGNGERDWLSNLWPCGRLLCPACSGRSGGRARPGVVWSQVMSA